MDGRPKLVHIDETNSRAAEKLLGSQEELVEDTYFLMQMPCVLPEMRNPEPRPQWDQCISACCRCFFFEESEGSWSTFRKTKSSGSRRMPSQQVQVGCQISSCLHALVMLQLFEDQPLPDSQMENWASCGYTSCFAQKYVGFETTQGWLRLMWPIPD